MVRPSEQRFQGVWSISENPWAGETGEQAFPAVRYQAARHAAVRTGDYLFAQLVPYLGNKRKLLPLIAEAVGRTGVGGGTFADLFAGSGVVSRWAKVSGFRVIANDWEPYAQILNGCAIALNAPPCLPDTVFADLNALPPLPDGYLARHFCPADDARPEPLQERCFWTRANGGKLDAVRETLAAWRQQGRLSDAQEAYLLAPLLYAASYVSNTSGVFKAYHHGWGGRTGTALYRILSDLTLQPPPLLDNGLDNRATQLDALILARQWRDLDMGPLEIAYLDPPYNQHPYGSNYHLLNTLVLWDKPPVPEFGRGGKSAIRTDWRLARRSGFNHAGRALETLLTLVDALPTRWILLSYSTDGNISLDALLGSMASRGATTLLPRRYKRYRVSTPRMSPRPHTIEFVLTLDRAGRPQPGQADEHRALLAAAGP